MAEKKDLRINSKVYTESNVKAPNRAMLRAVGFTDEKFQMPQIGVASNWAETTPCNIHLNDLAQFAKRRCEQSGRCADPVQYNHGCRRYCDGNPGHAFFTPFKRYHR